MNVLIIVNKLLNVCGITNHVYHFLSRVPEAERYGFMLLSGGDEAADKFRVLGYTVLIDADYAHENRSAFGYGKAVIKLFALLKKYRIELIHSHHFYAASIAGVAAGPRGTQTLLTNHGLIPEKGLLPHFSASHIIAVNEHIRAYLLDVRKISPERVHLIRAGVPSYEAVSRQRIKTRFLAAGRLVHEKGMDVFIKAVASLAKEKHNDAEFFIAGAGPEKETLEALARETDARVTFLGNVPNLFETLTEYDVFIMPTRSIAEGFPLAVVEAGMAGLLVVTSDFRGLREVFEPGSDGLMFPPEDASRLAELIRNVLAQPEQYSELASNFNKKAASLFDLSQSTRLLLELYETIRKKKAAL